MEQLDIFKVKFISQRYIPAADRKNNMYAKIIEYLSEHGPATNREIAKHLRCEVCSVTGRIFEMREMGYVEFDRQRKCSVTNNFVSSWRLCGLLPSVRSQPMVSQTLSVATA